MSLEVREERRGEVFVVWPAGRVDSNTSADLERSLLARGAEPRLVLDLSGVEYVSSAGLRVFLMLARKMKASNGSLVICALSPSAKQVFDLAGFTSLFVVEASMETALARMGSW